MVNRLDWDWGKYVHSFWAENDLSAYKVSGGTYI